MSNFPKLKPAFTFKVVIGATMAVGTSSRGSSLNIVPMVAGSLVSEPGYDIQLDGTWEGSGNDYIRVDPDQKIMRLDAHAVIKDKQASGGSGSGLLYIHYQGKIAITEALGKILSGAADMASTPWGDAFTHLHFETGDEKLRPLENGVFVSAGHFLVEQDRTVVVEYKVSQVVLE